MPACTTLWGQRSTHAHVGGCIVCRLHTLDSLLCNVRMPGQHDIQLPTILIKFDGSGWVRTSIGGNRVCWGKGGCLSERLGVVLVF